MKNRETSRRNTRGTTTTGARNKEGQKLGRISSFFFSTFWRETNTRSKFIGVFLKISSRRSGAEYDRCAWNARVDGVGDEK